MVYIIKKQAFESEENLLERVAALMLNMEYNLNIYDIENADGVPGSVELNNPRKRKEKFNITKYEFFNDVYTFNCGTVIFTKAWPGTEERSKINQLIKKIEIYMKRLDIYSGDTIYKPYTESKKFATTQYCAVWKKQPAYTNASTYRRLIAYTQHNTCSTSQRINNKFIWEVSATAYMQYVDNKVYRHTFRSLSTIIVDTQDILKYNEDMTPIVKSFSHNINYPIYKQIDLLNKKILSFTIGVDQIFGIHKEFHNWIHMPIASLPRIVYYRVDWSDQDLNLLPVNDHVIARGTRKVMLDYLEDRTPGIYTNPASNSASNPASDQISNLSPVIDREKYNPDNVDIRTTKSPYDICLCCTQPLFDDIYVIEKESNKAQVAICAICFHYNDYNDIIDRKKKLFSVLITKIPRSIYEAIDLMNKPYKVPFDDFNMYKNLLKIIHCKFPKRLDAYDIGSVGDIEINDKIILCGNFTGIWYDLYRVNQLKHKIIVPIVLT